MDGKNESKLTRVEIITPVHNRRELTLQCLKSLALIDKTDLDVHIIVVDDGSTDGTSEAVEKFFPEAEIIKGDGNLWFAGAVNRGINAALSREPDYVLIINDDTVQETKFLQYLIECSKKYPRSVVGPLLLLWDDPEKLFQVSPKWNMWVGGWKHWQNQTLSTIPQKPWEVELIVGNCILFPVEAIKENGLMNEERFPHFGDAEYTPRMRRNGWKLLIEPRAKIFCQPNVSPPSLRRMGYGKIFHTLFVDKISGNSLRRRFYANIEGAPNPVEGTLAFFIFYIRYFLGKNAEGSWASRQIEKPLAETFAEKIVKD
jgi:GT2 family glycosyltransferase